MPNTRTTKNGFDAFDEALNLDPAERLAAESRHREITECLTETAVAESTFLQGSFARKTMPKPLKDVDMVILLTPELWPNLQKPGGATTAFEMLKPHLVNSFPGAQFDVDGQAAHALQVTFPDLAFTFDLVPAFADPEGGEDVFIADREDDAWERSNARRLKRVVSERNILTGGALVHQIRMLKAFNKYQLKLDACGLVLESIGFAAIGSRQPHSNALVLAFEWAAANVHDGILDPTGVDDVISDWDLTQRAAHREVFLYATERGREALVLESEGEHEAAIEIWSTILGDSFPAAAPQTVDEALAGLTAGSVTTEGRVVTSMLGNQPVRPGRSHGTLAR